MSTVLESLDLEGPRLPGDRPTMVWVDGLDTFTGQILVARLVELAYVVVGTVWPKHGENSHPLCQSPMFIFREPGPNIRSPLDFHFEVLDRGMRIHIQPPVDLMLERHYAITVYNFVGYTLWAWGMRRSNRWGEGTPFIVTPGEIEKWAMVRQIQSYWGVTWA